MDTGIKWYDPDLKKRLEIAADYISDLFDADRDDEPFFGVIKRDNATVYANHAIAIGIPHVTGRALDAIFNIENTAGKSSERAEAIHTRYIFSCAGEKDAMPYYIDPDRDNGAFVEFHNLREYIEGLLKLAVYRKNENAEGLISRLVDHLYSITLLEKGVFSNERIKDLGYEQTYISPNHPLPVAAGRIIAPLLWYYKHSGNLKALELASAFSGSTLKCFSDDGVILDSAGNHVHSITSSLSGIMEYALLSGRQDYIDKIKLIIKNGLEENMSSYGWVKEQLWLETDQGETNQIGDIVQIFLMLAGRENPAYWYSRAEKFMRGGILPSQVLCSDGLTDTDRAPADNSEYNITNRMLGGFGFATPTAHMQHASSAINTVDITQGAVQSICRFIKDITTKSEDGLYVNLLFSWDTHHAKVESLLPGKGDVSITLKEEDNLYIRLPERIRPDSINLTVDGYNVTFQQINGYIALGKVKCDSVVCLRFAPIKESFDEFIYHHHYVVTMYGEQVIKVEPLKGVYPLFGEFPETEE